MTRLTNDMRARITRECVDKQFNDEFEKLKKEENALGMKCYREIFDLKTRKAAEEMPERWLRMDGCLRFNCAGYHLTFRVTPPVPVPYSNGCERLGNITGDLASQCQDYSNKAKDLNQKRNEAMNKLASMLAAIGTTKALEKTWPEGKPFYSRYLVVSEGAALPAIQVDDINKLLGLKKVS